MPFQIPKTRDTLQDLIKKLLWTTLQANYGVGSEEEYNTVINQVVAAGGDTTSIATLQNAAGGSASRVGGFTTSAFLAPTVDTGAYADGDAIGTPSLISLFRLGVGSGVVQNVSLVCDGTAPAADFDILLFRANPVASTIDDNDALVLTDADVVLLAGTISVPTADWLTCGTGRNVQTIKNTGIALQTTDPTGAFGYLAYVALLARGAITFSAADSLRMVFGVLQD